MIITHINMETTFSKIAEFIIQELGNFRKPLNKNTTLDKDLGLAGDDAGEFMSLFFREFSIETKNFDFEKHFVLEGFSLINFSALFKKSKQKNTKYIPITLGHLEKVAIEKVWTSPTVA